MNQGERPINKKDRRESRGQSRSTQASRHDRVGKPQQRQARQPAKNERGKKREKGRGRGRRLGREREFPKLPVTGIQKEALGGKDKKGRV